MKVSHRETEATTTTTTTSSSSSSSSPETTAAASRQSLRNGQQSSTAGKPDITAPANNNAGHGGKAQEVDRVNDDVMQLQTIGTDKDAASGEGLMNRMLGDCLANFSFGHMDYGRKQVEDLW